MCKIGRGGGSETDTETGVCFVFFSKRRKEYEIYDGPVGPEMFKRGRGGG